VSPLRPTHGEVDAQLLAFLHDLPEGASEAIGELMKAAAAAGAKKSSKQAWVRLGVESFIIGAAIVGGLLKLGDVATKGDIKSLEQQYAKVLDARISQDETQNSRISMNEYKCETALSCCTEQTRRVDIITSPRSSR